MRNTVSKDTIVKVDIVKVRKIFKLCRKIHLKISSNS